MEKDPAAFRTISEVAQQLDVPQHVLRFWETRFAQIKPLKRGGGRRYYRPDDVELLKSIRHLLYGEGYTIRGVQRLLKDKGPRGVTERARMSPEEAAAAGGEADGPELDGAELHSPDLEIDPGPDRDPAVRDGWPETDLADAGSATSGRAAVSQETLDHLRRALFDIAECERLLSAAREF